MVLLGNQERWEKKGTEETQEVRAQEEALAMRYLYTVHIRREMFKGVISGIVLKAT